MVFLPPQFRYVYLALNLLEICQKVYQLEHIDMHFTASRFVACRQSIHILKVFSNIRSILVGSSLFG